MPGLIRVGRCIYGPKGQVSYPSYEGFTSIIVMMKSHSKYFPLSPYYLKDDKGRIMENLWQFSKLYEKVPKTTQKYSRWDPSIIWDHPAETHFIKDTDNPDDGELTPEYFRWRKKGFEAKEAIRYPVGYHHRTKCLCALKEGQFDQALNYIESRHQIYLPLYCSMVRKKKQFIELKKLLDQGENLLIIEVDGPHQESLPYYQEKYQVADDFIDKHTVLATRDNLDILLNDDKHPFGHGYCLAMALLDFDK